MTKTIIFIDPYPDPTGMTQPELAVLIERLRVGEQVHFNWPELVVAMYDRITRLEESVLPPPGGPTYRG